MITWEGGDCPPANGEKLYCMVKDNGIGMEQEKLRSLWADIKAEEPQETNIAIRNIYQRLGSTTGRISTS